jgi:acetylornithine deacetylase/succinyl-diaminopimelate desuccinylase-like protein
LRSAAVTTGVTLREALDAAGSNTAAIARAARQPGTIKAVLELHVEQGPPRAGRLSIGVVTAITGNARWPIHLRGQQAHSGPMPMAFRRDAMTAAAEIIW